MLGRRVEQGGLALGVDAAHAANMGGEMAPFDEGGHDRLQARRRAQCRSVSVSLPSECTPGSSRFGRDRGYRRDGLRESVGSETAPITFSFFL
jgi:hypothetical protein